MEENNITGKLLSIISSRRSIRCYLQKTVAKSEVMLLLEAARWAPSAHNRQPWRFIVLYDETLRKKLLDAMATDFQRDLRRDGLTEGRIEHIIKKAQHGLRSAPLLIIGGIDMTDMDHYPDKRRQLAEKIMATQSLAAATQNILLLAHIRGLGTCWRCAPLFCAPTVRKALNQPPSFEPQLMITLGYPAESPLAPPRKLVTEWTTILEDE
ncbi:MAG: nitroreductase family protein [Candidatus Ranarchaeia archaeon]